MDPNPVVNPDVNQNPGGQPDPQEELRIAETAEMFNKADKILKAMQTPQAIRELPQFDGNPVKLHCFIRAVENLLPFLEALQDTPFEKVWLQSIRAKIVGDADQVLEIYGTPLEWGEIKANLIAYYNDKRDAVTLTREMFQLQQNGSIEEFYGAVHGVLSLIINHTNISTDDLNLRADRIKTHQENALQVFLAGLKEPIGGNVRARQPKKLKEAFDASIEERNFQNRCGLNKAETMPRPPKPLVFPPPLPPPKQRNLNNFYQRPQSQPQIYLPQNNQNFNRSNQYQQNQNFNAANRPFQYQQNYQGNNRPQVPPRNVFATKPAQMPKPVPMEVDPSIRSRKVNYMNRPHVHYHEGVEYDEQQCLASNFEHDYEVNTDQDPVPNLPEPSQVQDDEENSDELNFHVITQFKTNR